MSIKYTCIKYCYIMPMLRHMHGVSDLGYLNSKDIFLFVIKIIMKCY